jgi:small subunit ribosomal protein S3
VGQKVHPIGYRLGVYLDWDSRWFAKKKDYGNKALEDIKIRQFVKESLSKAEVSRIEIEKAGDSVKIIIHSARPGFVIGKKGQEIDVLRSKIAKMLNVGSVEVSVQEVKTPELDAKLVARAIADELERRVSFKKAMKKAAASTMRAGAKGMKICVSGRLNGAEIARSEWTRIGAVPLHTLRSDIDYSLAEAHTTYGIIGVKVWICRGEYNHA